MFEQIIQALAPQLALRRAHARLVLGQLQRGYEGAKGGRRIEDWLTSGASANGEVAGAGSRLRDRARDLVRNNCYASKALDILVGNAIGTGIIPQARTDSARLNKQIMAAWESWSYQCDAEGDLDYYGIQALVARSMFESGECFVRFRDRPVGSGLAVPLQLQVLEADFLDAGRNTSLAQGGYIKQGIEFDAEHRRVAYWLWKYHPGEQGGQQSIRVPADQILHIYQKQRPGQIRGVSSFAPAMIRLRDLDGYDDAELWRKKIEACFAAFVVQQGGMEGPRIGNIATTQSTEKVEQFRPGMIEYLQPGEDIKFGAPTSDGNYEAYERVQLHAIAAGLGVTYEQLTGDLSQVNYSSLRAGLLEFRRIIEMLRWQVFVPKLCMPIWRRFIDRAYIAGAISKQDYRVSWTPQKFEMIDPLKDAEADTLMMRNGTLTLQEAIARQGFDPEMQLEEIAAINAKLDALGIVLDSDPRQAKNQGEQNGSPTPSATD